MTRLRFLALYFAAWVPVALVYGLLIYLQRGERDIAGSMIGGSQSILYAALIGLAVWPLSRRLAERQRPLGALLGAHVGMALLYSIIWTAMVIASIAVFAPPEVLTTFLRFAVGWHLLTGVFLYGMVAGISHGVTVGQRLRREREAVTRAEALRARAELGAVRAQMNPHFLFNTLHSIAAIVRSDPDAAERALERLAALLRRLLDANRDSGRVTLGDEWAIVKEQLALEQLRFGDRLAVETQLDPDALDCVIPVLTFQPLVENAVRHGVAPRTERTTIHISAQVRGDELTIEVRDDGRGADLRAATSGTGLGLRSVKQRLLAEYGDRSGFKVATSPGLGFVATMSLPAITMPVTTGEQAVPVAAR